jgi:hypothetical protein
MLDAEDTAEVHHDSVQVALQEVPDGQEQVFLEGKELGSCRGRGCYHQQKVQGAVVPEADESSSGDDVEVLEVPRGESYRLHFTLQLI